MRQRDVSLTGIPHIGRATVIGAVFGALIVAVPVSVFLFILSRGDALSVLAGALVGIFAGMGYGGMVAAVIRANRYERTQGATNDQNVVVRGKPASRAA